MDSLTLTVKFKNYSFLIVECDYGIAQEISEYFSFYAKNYRYMPAYKNHSWDGRIKLFNASQRLLPIGLLKKLVRYCNDNDLDIVLDDEVKEKLTTSKYHIDAILDSYTLPFKAYDHQTNAIEFMVNKQRGIILSPTSSGKSLNIYVSTRHATERNKNSLIIVPTIQLVKQLASDFEDYGWDSDGIVHQIYGGQDKQTKKPVTISTWQSLQKMPESYFGKFDNIIVDECLCGNTPIKTPNGNIKIKDINVGDKIINFNEQSKEFKEDIVVNIHHNLNNSQSEKMYKLTFNDGSIVDVTGNHEFLTTDGWIRADKLENQEIINIGTYSKGDNIVSGKNEC